MADMLMNREHALARERELEAEIERLTARIVSDQKVVRQMEIDHAQAMYQLDLRMSEELRDVRQENDSLREQNATLRAEVERLTKGGAE